MRVFFYSSPIVARYRKADFTNNIVNTVTDFSRTRPAACATARP